MKKIFVFIFLLINCVCFAQNINKQKTTFNLKDLTATPKKFILPELLCKDFKIALSSNSLSKLNPIKLYTYSSTIYDATSIVLMENNIFIITSASCTQRWVSGGSYKIAGNKLILKSSKAVFNSIPKKIDELSYDFIEMNETKYLIANSQLKCLHN